MQPEIQMLKVLHRLGVAAMEEGPFADLSCWVWDTSLASMAPFDFDFSLSGSAAFAEAAWQRLEQQGDAKLLDKVDCFAKDKETGLTLRCTFDLSQRTITVLVRDVGLAALLQLEEDGQFAVSDKSDRAVLHLLQTGENLTRTSKRNAGILLVVQILAILQMGMDTAA